MRCYAAARRAGAAMTESLRGWWLVHAAPVEASALADLAPRCLGVGKAAAAATLAAMLAVEPRPRGVLLFGIAGAVPERLAGRPVGLAIGDVVAVGSDRFADEGVDTPQGWLDLGELGFGRTGPFVAAAGSAAATGLPVADASTVSTCSGTDARASTLWQRCGAVLESMEGAAVAMVCERFGVPWLQVRGVSNWTGDRDRAEWDVAKAVAAVQQAVRRLVG